MNIKNMLITSDFSELLNSTQADRDAHGGNQVIYDQLSNCICLDLVKQVALETFKDDDSIIAQIEKDCVRLHENKSCVISDKNLYEDINF